MKLLFSEMDPSASMVPVDLSCFEEEGLPVEAFAKVQDMFGSVDWLVPKSDDALNRLHQMPLSDIVNEMLETSFHQRTESRNLLQTLTTRSNQDNETKLDSVGTRSISLPRKLPSTTQTSIEASKKSLSLSSTMPPHIILTCAHPSVSEKLRETAAAASAPAILPADGKDGPAPPPPPPPPNKTGEAPPPPPPPGGGGGPPPPPPPAPGPPPPPAPPAPKAPAPPVPPPPKAKAAPPPPPPAAPSSNGNAKGAPPPPPALAKDSGGAAAPPPPMAKGRLSRTSAVKSQPTKKLKALHWSKINKPAQGSLWAESQKHGEASRCFLFFYYS
ncbi:uncharacterized protein LOC143569235 [Bidens hawaiensis]|uniref:uncharacterized protein LOC143569235 n=1 Tax=Bidens hawaiensis TaxID=980011 RepID=UPI004049ED3B